MKDIRLLSLTLGDTPGETIDNRFVSIDFAYEDLLVIVLIESRFVAAEILESRCKLAAELLFVILGLIYVRIIK